LVVVAAAVTPFVLYAGLSFARERTMVDSSMRDQSLARARTTARSLDERLQTVDRLLDSAMVRVRRPIGTMSALQFPDSTANPLHSALSIGVIAPGGGRTGELLGAASRIDAIPLERRNALIGAAMGSVRRNTSTAAPTFVDDGGTRALTDSIAMIIVRPLPRVSGNCRCLAETPGAVVAVLSDKALQALLGADTLPDGGVAVLIGSAGVPLGRIAKPERWTDRETRDTSVLAASVEREGVLQLTGQDEVSRAVGFAALTQLPWRVFVGVPAGSVSSLPAQNLRDALLLTLLAMGIAAVGVVVAARNVSAPLQTLVADTKRLAAGALSHRTDVAQSGGEIGALGEAMNALATDLEAQRKAMQDELRRATLIFEESPIAMWVADASTEPGTGGRIQQANPAAARMFGFMPGGLIGRRDSDLLDAKSAHLVAPASAAELQSASVHRNGRALLRTIGGTSRECTLSVSIVTAAWQPMRIVTALPVPQLSPIAAPTTVAPQMVQTPAHEHDAALVQFAGQIADQFNTLLNGLSGFTKLALESADDADMRTIALERIRDLSADGLAMTRQMQAYGQRDALFLTMLDANETLSDVVHAMAGTLGRDVELDVLYDVSPALVHADAALLNHVACALVTNARDAMPAGGTLTLATTLVEVPANSKERFAAPAGRYIVLTVADTGMGMSAEAQQHMFDPFYSTKPQRGTGVGLGLAGVAGIAREHGWTISVDSEPAVGTAISIYIPEVEVPVAEEVLPPVQSTLETVPARNA
jgi:PAS domain S-box-containing protein